MFDKFKSFLNQEVTPRKLLIYITLSLFIALIVYIWVLSYTPNISVESVESVESNINLYIPLIFLGFSIIFSICFLYSNEKYIIFYYLFIISITALSLSFIEIHRETEEMVKNIKDIDNFKLILIKSISILIPAIAFVTNYFSATLIDLFKRNNQA